MCLAKQWNFSLVLDTRFVVIYFVMLLTVLRCFGGEVKEEEWTLYKDMVVSVLDWK